MSPCLIAYVAATQSSEFHAPVPSTENVGKIALDYFYESILNTGEKCDFATFELPISLFTWRGRPFRNSGFLKTAEWLYEVLGLYHTWGLELPSDKEPSVKHAASLRCSGKL